MTKSAKISFLILFLVSLGFFISVGICEARECHCSATVAGPTGPISIKLECDNDCKTGPCEGHSNCRPVDSGASIDIERPGIQVEIGGFSDKDFTPLSSLSKEGCKGGNCIQVDWLGQYIGVIYRYGVGLAAVLAVIMIMVGGFLWLTSAGSPDRVGKAKEFITSALTGLLLALFSFIILYTVNPELIDLKPIGLREVEAGAPGWTTQGGGSTDGTEKCSGSSCIVGGYDFGDYATSPTHVDSLNSILDGMGDIDSAQDAQDYIDQRYPGSPVTGEMVMDSADRYDVDPAVLLAEMALDSRMGTDGRGEDSNNPGNVANADTEADTRHGCQPPGSLCTSDSGTLNCCYPTWQDGVDAVANWMDGRRV